MSHANHLDRLPPLIPRAVIFGNPERADPQLSPDGRRMAFLAPLDGVLNVWLGPTGREKFRPVTRDTDRGIRNYFWAHDGRHLLYLQDVGGDENWQLFKVEPEDGEPVNLTPFEGVQTHVVALEKRRPGEVLIALNRDDPRLHDVYRVDLVGNGVTLVAKNPGTVVGWVADAELRVRAAVATTADGGMDLLVRGGDGDAWSTLLRWSSEDALTSGPVGFSLDGRTLRLLDSRDANTARLVELDLSSGTTRVLVEDPTYDVADVLVHPDTRAVQLVTFVKARREHLVLDDAIRADVDAISRLNPGDFAIQDRTHADDVWLMSFTEDDRPVSYWTFDRAARTGRLLFFARPRLAEYTLAPMEPIAFRARDGLTIHGYLTRPAGLAGERLPLVLDVHGGPWHRDVWGYDPEAQWLANRGYACLQVNFRGSTGYGKRFLNAGNREWGGKMQDDLVDAVRWAVERGVADPERVAIYGGSYGGYAALAGATFTPDLFRCAVAVVGPSNLLTFIESIPPYWSSYLAMLHERVGHPERDAEFLRSRSPLFHVDRITIPLLVAQGANDPRVKRAESEQVVAAMREKAIPHEYLLFPDEGHGFAKPANRLRFHAAAERFLARHLGGRFETDD